MTSTDGLLSAPDVNIGRKLRPNELVTIESHNIPVKLVTAPNFEETSDTRYGACLLEAVRREIERRHGAKSSTVNPTILVFALSGHQVSCANENFDVVTNACYFFEVLTLIG